MNVQLQMLDEAEQHFRHKRFQDGAALVWNAALQSIAVAGKQVGLPSDTRDDAYATALAMNRIRPTDHMDHHLYLTLAEIYRRQAAAGEDTAEWQWEQRDYIDNLAGIRDMVKNLAGE